MNRETIIVYTIAALIGSALAYLVNIPTGIVAGLSTIGATVILWHAFDTVRGAVESHYSEKYRPKADEKKTSAL